MNTQSKCRILGYMVIPICLIGLVGWIMLSRWLNDIRETERRNASTDIRTWLEKTTSQAEEFIRTKQEQLNQIEAKIFSQAERLCDKIESVMRDRFNSFQFIAIKNHFNRVDNEKKTLEESLAEYDQLLKEMALHLQFSAVTTDPAFSTSMLDKLNQISFPNLNNKEIQNETTEIWTESMINKIFDEIDVQNNVWAEVSYSVDKNQAGYAVKSYDSLPANISFESFERKIYLTYESTAVEYTINVKYEKPDFSIRADDFLKSLSSIPKGYRCLIQSSTGTILAAVPQSASIEKFQNTWNQLETNLYIYEFHSQKRINDHWFLIGQVLFSNPPLTSQLSTLLFSTPRGQLFLVVYTIAIAVILGIIIRQFMHAEQDPVWDTPAMNLTAPMSQQTPDMPPHVQINSNTVHAPNALVPTLNTNQATKFSASLLQDNTKSLAALQIKHRGGVRDGSHILDQAPSALLRELVKRICR